jgi:alpha-galactosidase
MLEWHTENDVAVAARFLLNVLFSVPQISVRLAEIPADHKAMLRFWINFCAEHRETLLFGELRPYSPEFLYPLVEARGADETVWATYQAGALIDLRGNTKKKVYIVNASPQEEVALRFTQAPSHAEAFDCIGNTSSLPLLTGEGIACVTVPLSGLAVLTF